MQTKKWKFSLLSIVLVLSLVLTSISAVLANEIIETAEEENQKQGILENAEDNEKIHDSIDISEIRNEGGNPPELLSKASSLASADKQWYEYIRYSSEPIGICDLGEKTRVVFHDPYDYGNSLIMEVDDSITDWSSSNSLTSTYETGNTMTFESTKSNETVSSIEVAKGADRTSDVSVTTVEGQVKTYNNSKSKGSSSSEDSDFTTGGGSTEIKEYGTWDVATSTGLEGGLDGSGIQYLAGVVALSKSDYTKTTHHGTEKTTTRIDPTTTFYYGYSEYEDEITDEGYTEDNTTTTTKTNVSTVVADRISTSTGHNIAETQSWSTSDSHSISKTYEASYFNSSGSPLQWKIVKYKVIMPLLYKTQYLIDGEWITADSGYCTLTTIQGTCRSWLENNTAYYEHWGTGEPVTWNEFWGTFFTKENLIQAYKNKLYPEQIRSVSAE